ncbi:DUF2635 domain-containing protein [Xenorhabdus griffiniae]|uniref:DUF2635 domain-containing protein n=1 Tax=Xenorhabdus griffiniae TaxID=351672 RepID=UPI00235A44BE|nr:DUF2635 domain-containing protein [Xenorhabdus griffiniae]MDC9607053.1 DUF2635 domain-containing protein [Xenorhabdus griffiniae]
MLVKPVAGRRVRCPVRGEFLPESGADVPDNLFWHRRLRDGDVEIYQMVAETKVAKKGTQETE